MTRLGLVRKKIADTQAAVASLGGTERVRELGMAIAAEAGEAPAGIHLLPDGYRLGKGAQAKFNDLLLWLTSQTSQAA